MNLKTVKIPFITEFSKLVLTAFPEVKTQRENICMAHWDKLSRLSDLRLLVWMPLYPAQMARGLRGPVSAHL